MAIVYIKRPSDITLFAPPDGFVPDEGDGVVKMTFEEFVRAMLNHKRFASSEGPTNADAIEIALEHCVKAGYLSLPRGAANMLSEAAQRPEFLMHGDGGATYCKIFPFPPQVCRKIAPFVEACKRILPVKPENSAPACDIVGEEHQACASAKTSQ